MVVKTMGLCAHAALAEIRVRFLTCVEHTVSISTKGQVPPWVVHLGGLGGSVLARDLGQPLIDNRGCANGLL